MPAVVLSILFQSIYSGFLLYSKTLARSIPSIPLPSLSVQLYVATSSSTSILRLFTQTDSVLLGDRLYRKRVTFQSYQE